MTDHDSILALIPEYAQGRLAPAEHDRVDAHLSGCSECRGLLADCKSVAVELDAALSAELRDHPSTEDLSMLVFSPRELSVDARRRLEFHLEVCRRCAADLEHVRALAQEATVDNKHEVARPAVGKAPGFAQRLRSIFSRPLVAFSAVVATIALLAIPLLNQQSGDTPDTTVGAVRSGSELTVALAEQTRSGLSRRTVAIAPEHQIVKFEMRFIPEDGRNYTISVLSVKGKSVYQEPLPSVQAQAGLAEVRLPSHDLPDGDYAAVVSSVSAQGDPHSVFYPFTIKR